MIILLSAGLGVVLGIYSAKRRKGGGLDMLQYATVYGIAFSLLGVFLNLLIGNLVG